MIKLFFDNDRKLKINLKSKNIFVIDDLINYIKNNQYYSSTFIITDEEGFEYEKQENIKDIYSKIFFVKKLENVNKVNGRSNIYYKCKFYDKIFLNKDNKKERDIPATTNNNISNNDNKLDLEFQELDEKLKKSIRKFNIKDITKQKEELIKKNIKKINKTPNNTNNIGNISSIMENISNNTNNIGNIDIIEKKSENNNANLNNSTLNNTNNELNNYKLNKKEEKNKRILDLLEESSSSSSSSISEEIKIKKKNDYLTLNLNKISSINNEKLDEIFLNKSIQGKLKLKIDNILKEGIIQSIDTSKKIIIFSEEVIEFTLISQLLVPNSIRKSIDKFYTKIFLNSKEKKIAHQVNYYFGEKNFYKDNIIQDYIKQYENKGMHFKHLLEFKRIKDETSDLNVILTSLNKFEKDVMCNYKINDIYFINKK